LLPAKLLLSHLLLAELLWGELLWGDARLLDSLRSDALLGKRSLLRGQLARLLRELTRLLRKLLLRKLTLLWKLLLREGLLVDRLLDHARLRRAGRIVVLVVVSRAIGHAVTTAASLAAARLGVDGREYDHTGTSQNQHERFERARHDGTPSGFVVSGLLVGQLVGCLPIPA
jgi:hypothetical protein